MSKDKTEFRTLWGIFMSLVYIGIAYLILFTPLLIRYNETNNPDYDNNATLRIIFAIILCSYGIIRGYRTWKGRMNG